MAIGNMCGLMQHLCRGLILSNFWKGKKVLVTGHTGFKGSWLTIILESFGADICGIALPEDNIKGLFARSEISKKINHNICNINNREKLREIINNFQPELIFHMAAQPLVRYSYQDPYETYNTNVIGSLNVLDAGLSSKNLKSFIFITTDKVYKNLEKNEAYTESDELGGHDPYSSSKACSEILAMSYRKSFYEHKNIPICTVRAGNVIGGGDWSKDRLLPDIVRSIQNKQELEVRSPRSTRPWQHVLEPIFGYISIAEKGHNNMKFNESFNFGPDSEGIVDVETIVKKAKDFDNRLNYKIVEKPTLHEAKLLKLDISKVKTVLDWKPKLDIDRALQFTLEWYQAENLNQDILEFTKKQINEYIKL